MSTDEFYMKCALVEARRGELMGEVPVGAVIVHDRRLIASAFNRPIGLADPTAHAEVLAIREAAYRIGNYRLTGATLYVTLEPCAMCAGALIHARIRRLVYGAADIRAGAVESVFRITDNSSLNHRVEVASGVLENECRGMLQSFFLARRAR
ncbi:MAG: tRNA adenosine(34) deaminase TadA [Acidobacteria bacterium]|jgi:tRNA(adenine34) deaminase|nr:tRNA adenosine(34) deaminase TadA [Acidobacteriota bacterium]